MALPNDERRATSDAFDVVVIGAGINGLVAAHVLARAGRQVLVLDQRPAGEPALATGWVPPVVVKALRLARHGLVVQQPDPWVSLALPDGGRLELPREQRAALDAIRRVSPPDAERWPAFTTRMRRLALVLEDLYQQPAPDPLGNTFGELLRLGILGLKVRGGGGGRGRQATIDLLRILPMSAWELLDEWFEHDALRAALAGGAIRNLLQGPKGGGTAFSLLHHHTGCASGVFRQPRSNVQKVLESLPGVTVRRGARVGHIAVKAGRASGVVLDNGDEIATPLVVSTADPRATLLGLVDAEWLDPELLRAVRNIKCRGVAARVTLQLEQPAPFTTLTIGASLTYLERAYDDAKYGRISTQPFIEADADGSRVTAHVQYVPHDPAGGWTDQARQALGEIVVKEIEGAAPGVAATVREATVAAPADLAAAQGLTGGHAYHGELTLDQILFMRPVPGVPRYRTPVRGLFLGGAGTHPGGAILGGPGLLAARAALAER